MVMPVSSKFLQSLNGTSIASVFRMKQNIFGYFDPESSLKIMKINIFRGDLTDTSAKKAALGTSLAVEPEGVSRSCVSNACPFSIHLTTSVLADGLLMADKTFTLHIWVTVSNNSNVVFYL